MTLPVENIAKLIKENKQIRTEIIKNDESVIDDIYKFLENPTNTLYKTTLYNYINKNSEFINNVVKNSFSPPPIKKIVVEENKPTVSFLPEPQKVAGDVYEIDPTPNSYKEFIEHAQAQRWIYRGISVMQSGNGKWMVFFY